MIRVDIKKTDFYNELPEDKQREYFTNKDHKFFPAIDNIYYSVFLQDDNNDNWRISGLLKQLEELKNEFLSFREPQEFENGLQLDGKVSGFYKYCLSNPDLYDIFILNHLPNLKTPRILVQIRAYGLWMHGADKMLMDSYNHVAEVFEPLDIPIERCRENRIDYCYHTNAIVNPEKIFSDKNVNKQMTTSMKNWQQAGRIESKEGNTKLRKDYFAIGNRKSNNVFIRMYNKALEVIEEGYKGFFFELWYQQGLISFYDKYCFQFAYAEKNYDCIHKAKMNFYLEYGTNERVKREYYLWLNDLKATHDDFKVQADAYMPEVSTVMNIEYQTMRKFYYYSDEFIDSNLEYIPRSELPPALNHLFKITDNRSVFLNYLTSKTLCFKGTVRNRKKKEEPQKDNEQESDKKSKKEKKVIYAPWWERLRNTKLKGIKTDEELIRKYSTELDEIIVKKRFIGTVATNAVYANNIGSDFVADISDLMSSLNDNDIHKLNLLFQTDDGKTLEALNSQLLNTYKFKKLVKEKRLRNRIKKDGQAVADRKNTY